MMDAYFFIYYLELFWTDGSISLSLDHSSHFPDTPHKSVNEWKIYSQIRWDFLINSDTALTTISKLKMVSTSTYCLRATIAHIMNCNGTNAGKKDKNGTYLLDLHRLYYINYGILAQNQMLDHIIHKTKLITLHTTTNFTIKKMASSCSFWNLLI